MTHTTARKAREAETEAQINEARTIRIAPETPGLFTIHDKEGHLVAAYTQDGNLIGGEVHRELLRNEILKARNRTLAAERDTALEQSRFWRRLTVIASAACVIGTAINCARALGWF